LVNKGAVNVDSEELKEYSNNVVDTGTRIVAFLDILGFEEHVKRYVNGEDKKIIEKLKSALTNALKNTDDFERIGGKYKIFSDCTSLSIPDYLGTKNEATMLCSFMTLIKGYTFKLINEEIYLRGGISVGFHHEDEMMIFSEGLIKAYHLENEEAVYPRTILDEELVQRFEWLWINQKDTILTFGIEKLLITDELGITFVNHFNLMQSMGKATLEDMRKQFNNEDDFKAYLQDKDNEFNTKILGNVEDKIDEYEGNKRVLRKYLWLKELLKWNMDPKSSRIRFEYLLK
jgi:hypothetical protein